MSVYIENYSKKYFAVRGETKSHEQELKKLGGDFQRNLKGGEGWLFSKKEHKKAIGEWLLKITCGDKKKETKIESKLENKDQPDIWDTYDNIYDSQHELVIPDFPAKYIFLSMIALMFLLFSTTFIVSGL